MTTNHYKITIHISRKNTIRGQFTVPFVGSRTAAPDTVEFKNQKIIILADRTKKVTPTDDIIRNKSNSIYQQIFKALIFLYCNNSERIEVRSIQIDRSTKTKRDTTYSYVVDSHEQPIKNNYILPISVPAFVINKIWEENSEAAQIRIILTHWLSAQGSEDRFYQFERLWRTYERIGAYHLRPIKEPSTFNILVEMREFICNNVALFNSSISEADLITVQKFRTFDWVNYILSEFRPLSTSNKSKPYTDKYLHHFVKCNEDHRVIDMLDRTKDIRKTELSFHKIYDDVKDYINVKKSANINKPEHILCMLCNKYADYLRNKMFHGEKADFEFTFSKDTYDNKRIDIINNLLSKLTNELILSLDKL